jgi:hypothetical protein
MKINNVKIERYATEREIQAHNNFRLQNFILTKLKMAFSLELSGNIIKFQFINVRKNAAHKESSQEKSHIHRAKFNGSPKLPGWPGKRWHSSDSRPGVAFIEGGD